jgi:hypothetical protein
MSEHVNVLVAGGVVVVVVVVVVGELLRWQWYGCDPA